MGAAARGLVAARETLIADLALPPIAPAGTAARDIAARDFPNDGDDTAAREFRTERAGITD
jgi:hypothetical protein